MILFHGSIAVVETPNLDLSRKSLDFGIGFYTTVNKQQAIDFARKIAIRKGQNNQFVFKTEKALSFLKFKDCFDPGLIP